MGVHMYILPSVHVHNYTMYVHRHIYIVGVSTFWICTV